MDNRRTPNEFLNTDISKISIIKKLLRIPLVGIPVLNRSFVFITKKNISGIFYILYQYSIYLYKTSGFKMCENKQVNYFL